MIVRDWMSSPVVVAPPSMEAPQALALMEERKIRRLPVVEDNRLVGMVSLRDLLQGLGVYPSMWRRLNLKLSDVMKTDPIVISPEETLDEVARLMLEHKIGALPVIEAGAPVGIITESDIFRAFCQILGFQEKGTGFTAPGEAHILDVLRERLKDQEPRMVLAYLDERRKQWEVILRLQTTVVA